MPRTTRSSRVRNCRPARRGWRWSARHGSTRRPREEVLESTLEAERLVGIEENVEILPGDGGGFLRVRYPEDSINFSSADEETPLGGAAFYASVGRSKVSDRKSTRLNSSH